MTFEPFFTRVVHLQFHNGIASARVCFAAEFPSGDVMLNLPLLPDQAVENKLRDGDTLKITIEKIP